MNFLKHFRIAIILSLSTHYDVYKRYGNFLNSFLTYIRHDVASEFPVLCLNNYFSFFSFKLQKRFSEQPRICKLNFSEPPELKRNRVKNGVYIRPKEIKKKIYDEYTRHKELRLKSIGNNATYSVKLPGVERAMEQL